ncbi:MAG TPA: DUF5522 domain-containing protein [Chitinophagales bacterium]|nr:DUF5522 domain-containing protein [Chitinophagales bacterium]
MTPLKEGIDYYINEEGLFVFTASYHLKRGFCCNSGCRHCPYGFDKKRSLKSKLPPNNSTEEIT